MKKIFLLVFLAFSMSSIAQTTVANRLRVNSATKKNDATRVVVQDSITKEYHWILKSSIGGGGGGGGSLAETLAIDNKTNSIPIVSNDESSQILIDNSGNVSITSGASSERQLSMAEDSFYFNSNVRYVFDGQGIGMNTTSDGFGLPRLTTTAMNAIVAPTEGMLVRNTTESSIYQYNGTTWEPLGSSAPSLTEHQIAVGQVGDVFGSSSSLTFEGGDLKVSGNNVLTVMDGQPLDSDLTDIASLTPPNDNILQRKAGLWTSRTPSQLKTDLSLAKGDVGLGNVDNTSDANKPVSTATQSAIDSKVTDAIVDGVTTVAASQNAVFDALSLKQNNLKTFNRTQGINYFEEFMGNQAGNVVTNYSGITSTQSGTGASCVTTATITNRTNQQGVVRASTGTTTTGSAGFAYGGQSLFRGTGPITLETYTTVETLSTLAERFYNYFGYVGTGSAVSPNNGIFFLYDEGGLLGFGANPGSANWKCVTINSTVRTFTTTSIPVVAGQWYKLRIEINDASNSVGFYIDESLVATHTTNIPAIATATSILNLITKSTGTTARAMQTDYFMYDETFTTAR